MDNTRIKIKPNSNYHVLGAGTVFDFGNSKFERYRYEWLEYPKKLKVREFPMHLDIETTNYCNLRCAHCASSHDRWGSAKKGVMEFRLYKKLIDEGADSGLYSIKLSLRGEPLLHEELWRMISYAKAKGIIDIYFNTNAMLLSEVVSERLTQAGLNRISVSCDGWDEKSFEKNRAGAKFKTVYKNISTLKKIRDRCGAGYPKIRIQSVMLPEIKKHQNEFVKLWEPLADELGYLDARDEGPNVDHRGAVANWACPFLWQRMAILWDGTILPCLLHGVRDSSTMEMGNIKRTSIKKQWHSDRLGDYRKLHKKGESHKIKACDICSYRAKEIEKLQK